MRLWLLYRLARQNWLAVEEDRRFELGSERMRTLPIEIKLRIKGFIWRPRFDNGAPNPLGMARLTLPELYKAIEWWVSGAQLKTLASR